MANVYLFATPGSAFKLAVSARSIHDARNYVKRQGSGSLIHRRLKYVGKGHPDPLAQAGWVAAVTDRAREEFRAKFYEEA